MQPVLRSENVISNSKDLVSLYKLKNFPVFMGCVEDDISKDLKEDQDWSISPNNGIIQLTKLIPLNILYQSQHAGGVGMWSEHHKMFAKFIKKQLPKSVLEIGGAHGILSREYKKENSVNWTILEPNPSPAPGVDATFIKGFFDENFCFEGELDTIIHSHVFEHVYYPDKFIAQTSSFLKEGQKLIFSIPNLEEMLKRKYTNCLNFEHTMFITEPYINHLLSKHSFRQVDKQYFREDHSIFYSYIKDSSIDIVKIPQNMYENNKKLFLNYIDYHKNLIIDLNKKINKSNKQNPIYLFGAHVFAQSLIEFGLNTNPIVCLLDNDVKKQGKRLYGTNMKVESPKIIKDVETPIVILKAGVYNEEIKKDIIENINPNTEFWE